MSCDAPLKPYPPMRTLAGGTMRSGLPPSQHCYKRSNSSNLANWRRCSSAMWAQPPNSNRASPLASMSLCGAKRPRARVGGGRTYARQGTFTGRRAPSNASVAGSGTQRSSRTACAAHSSSSTACASPNRTCGRRRSRRSTRSMWRCTRVGCCLLRARHRSQRRFKDPAAPAQGPSPSCSRCVNIAATLSTSLDRWIALAPSTTERTSTSTCT
mmetsp:Transcript_58530/g.134289  ORF Transcript_58530/g.134289 Transcript_58530/m.134289 type:complete len:213 (-) Transcript_58530:1494-2132(-)